MPTPILAADWLGKPPPLAPFGLPPLPSPLGQVPAGDVPVNPTIGGRKEGMSHSLVLDFTLTLNAFKFLFF